MKKKVLILCLIVLASFTRGQVPALQWAKAMGGPNGEQGQSLTVDAFGNVYTSGSFVGVVDFDPGPAIFNLTSTGLHDIFISKLDASGNFIWAKNMGGINADCDNYSIATDASGNVYTTGYYQGIFDFDPSAGTFTLNSAGSNDVFISKLNASGNFVWAKSIGGTNIDAGNSLAVDASGNIFTTGFFYGTADFDTGAGTYTLTSNGSSDVFIQKMDNTGSFVWAKSFGGANIDVASSVNVDAGGNIYMTGFFESTVDFDPNAGIFNLSSSGLQDIFVSKLDASGNFVWAKKIGETYYDNSYDVAVNISGDIYLTGGFIGMVDFDPGVGVFNLVSAGNNDIFFLKLNASGDFVWAKSMGGTNSEAGHSIAFDVSGSVYSTGHFSGATDFDPGPATFDLTAIGDNDTFITKLDAGGNFIWAKAIGGIGTDGGTCVFLDAVGNIYTCGGFQETNDFDPGPDFFTLSSLGNTDVFIHKMSPCCESINELQNANADLKIWPNPANEIINYQINNSGEEFTIELIDMYGRVIKNLNPKESKGTINMNDLEAGIYFLKFSNKGFAPEIKKIIKT